MTAANPGALPWLEAPLQEALRNRRGHAMLVRGPAGVGQFELAMVLARAWLCEASDGEQPACGECAACRLFHSHTHPDLMVLLPDALRAGLGWDDASGEADASGADKASKAKPSKDIKVEAVRAAIAFAQTTSARGRCKVLVMHPAERMNHVAANALLKTLEEPPGDARLLLCSGNPDALLPTIRSRCQTVALALPPRPVALEWLAGQGVVRPEVLLAACGGQPLDVLDLRAQGVDAELWLRVPGMVARGEASALAALAPALLIDTLTKLCHDTLCIGVGAPPRYFAREGLVPGVSVAALEGWRVALQGAARHAEHPWNAGLLAESLVLQGATVLTAARSSRPAGQGASVNSAR